LRTGFHHGMPSHPVCPFACNNPYSVLSPLLAVLCCALVLVLLCHAGVAPEKLRVVPQGIDAADFDPNKHAPLSLKDLPSAQLVTGNSTGINSDSYTFLSVFKWEARKGWDVLLDAYVREFSKSDNVALHIFTKPFGRSDDVRLLSAHAVEPSALVCMGLVQP
jgi:hypothetical protein